MSPKVILIASLLVNAGLGFALMQSGKAPAGSEHGNAGNTAVTAAASSKKSHAGGSSVIITNEIKIDFDWRQLESPDYKDYIARLRAVGCPEVTIRDIIISDIDKLYEPKFLLLRDPNAYQPQKFWSTEFYGNGSRKRDPEKAAQSKALAEERSALIKELLGVEEKEIRQLYSTYDDGTQSRLAFLSADKQAQAKELEKKYGKERSDIYEKAGNMIDMDTQKELAALQKKQLAEMKSFMSPEEVFEYDIRTSDTARNMKWELKSFEPTEDEFRAIFAARRAQEDARASSQSGEKLTPEQAKQMSDARKQSQDELKATLGEDRYAEMQRSGDYSYSQLANAAPYLGYDKAAAVRVYNMKADAEKAASAIRNNSALSPEERTAALQDVRLATEKAVQQEIGEKGLKYYKRQGGYWLNNIAPRPVVTSR